MAGTTGSHNQKKYLLSLVRACWWWQPHQAWWLIRQEWWNCFIQEWGLPSCQLDQTLSHWQLGVCDNAGGYASYLW